MPPAEMYDRDMQILFFDLYSGFNISKRTNNILFVSIERERERSSEQKEKNRDKIEKRGRERE